VPDEPLTEESLRFMADELMANAKQAGLKLIFVREVEFRRVGELPSGGADYMTFNVLTICVERSDGAVRAMWKSA
jgi:hypothetical protein